MPRSRARRYMASGVMISPCPSGEVIRAEGGSSSFKQMSVRCIGERMRRRDATQNMKAVSMVSGENITSCVAPSPLYSTMVSSPRLSRALAAQEKYSE